MAPETMKVGDDTTAACSPFFRHARRARHLAFLLWLSVAACSGDDKTSDDDGKSSGNANADEDDDDDDENDDDDSAKKDGGSSNKDAGNGGGMMRADGGLIDSGAGASTKPDGSAPDTGSKSDSSSEPSAGGDCTRENLRTLIDKYFEALEAHDASSLPIASSVKYTENAETLQVGDGFWQTAGAVKFKRSAIDTETCSTVTEATVPNGAEDFVVGLRLKLEQAEITEIETILVAPGVWFQSASGLIETASDDWETELPEGERPTREELKKIVDDYFALFSGGANASDLFASSCMRVENGAEIAACSAGISSFGGRMTVRTYVLDEAAGIGAGFVIFAGTFNDFHMFKVRNGEVQSVHAVLANGRSSGWE